MSTTSMVPDITEALIEAIRAFPSERTVEHCNSRWSVPPFDFYTNCPACGTRLKLRSFSGTAEIEDIFDAVFEWMNQNGVEKVAQQRREQLKTEQD